MSNALGWPARGLEALSREKAALSHPYKLGFRLTIPCTGQLIRHKISELHPCNSSDLLANCDAKEMSNSNKGYRNRIDMSGYGFNSSLVQYHCTTLLLKHLQVQQPSGIYRDLQQVFFHTMVTSQKNHEPGLKKYELTEA